MSLFSWGSFSAHSGQELQWKIDCDFLSDADIETLAKVISLHVSFGKVIGVPTGGSRLAIALQKYATRGVLLIVDDVLTTGASMEEFYEEGAVGVVLFARGPLPSWVHCVFQLEMQ